MSAPDAVVSTGSTTRHVVIVGGGMAAGRLVEELLAAPDAPRITVLAEEQHAPYNRILLSAVLEGTHRPEVLTLRSEEWYAARGVDLRLGTLVVEIHRDRKVVELADRTEVAYDDLVLATGSIPSLPPIRGLVQVDGTLDPRVQAFRSLDDCARLLDAIAPEVGYAGGAPGSQPARRRAVVVGGGLLGLQVARALSIRGILTEIVEGADHLLHTQVDEQAGTVLKRSLTKLGTEVYLGARAVRLTREGLRLDNGVTLDTDLVVITAGGKPRANLARRAGLAVRKGIVVDDRLTSVDDPDIHAIGDCAEHDGVTTGFVAPAWEQAGILAKTLTGRDARYTGHRLVARLRATDLDVCVLGDPRVSHEHEAKGDVVEVTNPLKGTHRRLVLREGRIVAGAFVGDVDRVGLITQAYDRQTVLGEREAGALLLPEPTRTSTPELPDDAEVCACAGVSAGRIRACKTLAEVKEKTRASTGCGGCTATVQSLLTAVPAGT